MVWEGWSGLWRCETKLAGVVEGPGLELRELPGETPREIG